MKTTLDEISPVKKRLRVEIDAEEVNKKLNQAYNEIRSRAKIPGFRPGKAPRKILESYYGQQVKEDVSRDLVADSFPTAIGEVNTFPLGQPVLEKDALKQGESFIYSAIMEVRPEFEVKDHLGIEIKQEILSVTDEDVQKRIEEIRTANGKLVPLLEKRPIKTGDYAIVEYQAFENGQPVKGIQAPNQMMNVGKNDIHAQFDEGLVGLSIGDETEIDIHFEDDYRDTRLTGKQVQFKTRIVDVKELSLPNLDDAFARSLNPDFNDLEGLRAEIRKIITSQEERRIDRDLKQRLVQKISEGLQFELPEVLVETETDFSLRRFKDGLQRTGANAEAMGLHEEGLKKDFRAVAEMRVREMLILDQIATQEQITVTDEDLEEGFRDLAQHMGQDAETVRKYYEARGQVDGLKEELLKEKTLKYLADHANILKVEKAALGQDTAVEAREG